MKRKLHFFMTIIATVLFGSISMAQCLPGEGELTVDITTDGWGYEGYWELTPVGDACGTNTVYFNGNAAVVGCLGSGAFAAGAGDDVNEYGDNLISVSETVGCYTLGTCFDLHYVDDYNDTGMDFDFKVDGVSVAMVTGESGDGVTTFSVCVTAQAALDVQVDSVGVGTYYTNVPFSQLVPLSFDAKMTNAGSSDVTNAMITATVNDGVTDVATATSTAVATLVSAASSAGALTPGYTAVATGLHSITFVSSMTEVDEATANDSMTMFINYNDSILGRDANVVTGALGFGTGAADNGQMGFIMASPVADDMTSVSGFFSSPKPGDSTRFSIYDVAAGVPTAAVATTDAYTFTLADSINGVFLTLPLTSVHTVTAGVDFAVVVNEYNDNVSLATDNVSLYEAGTNVVISNSITAGAWVTAESLAPTFALNYILRANFASAASIGENALNSAKVYPNPTKGNVTVTLSESVDNATATVYSVNGTVVSSEVVSGTQFSVNLDGLTNGLYIMELNNGSEKGVYRIVKD